MLSLLGASPRVTALVILALLAFMVYHIVSNGRIQPLEVAVLILLSFLLLRTLPRLRQTSSADDEE